jgi:hypothetical protein
MTMTTEKFLDFLLLACSQRATFVSQDFYDKFVDASTSDEESYQQRKTVINALAFLESKHLVTGAMKVQFTPSLGLPTEVRIGAVTKFGRILVRVPKCIRLGLFFLLLRWEKIAAVVGTLAFLNLLRNAYLGLTIIAGWFEYASLLFFAWLVYWLIRRALA